MPEKEAATGVRLDLAHAVLTEAAIITQLATALLETRLPKGIVSAQYSVLNHLASRPEGQTPLRIARAFQVPKTSMTHSLAVLERAGLVETAPNPDDGRSKLARITSAGRALRAQTMASLAPDMARNLAKLAPDTLETLLPHIRHLREVLDAARDE
jgi:DNA-binding MarR family transcriptional regulator